MTSTIAQNGLHLHCFSVVLNALWLLVCAEKISNCGADEILLKKFVSNNVRGTFWEVCLDDLGTDTVSESRPH